MMQVLHRDADGIATQFRHIITLQEQDVPLGVLLRNDKGLVRTPLPVEVGDEEASIVLVHATTAEDEPAPVGTPGMEAVHIGRIRFRQSVTITRLKVLYP